MCTWLDSYIHLFGNIIDFIVPSRVPTSTTYLHALLVLILFLSIVIAVFCTVFDFFFHIRSSQPHPYQPLLRIFNLFTYVLGRYGAFVPRSTQSYATSKNIPGKIHESKHVY